MEREKKAQDTIRSMLVFGGVLAVITPLLLSAFSRPTRRKIKERSNYKSEVSGRCDMPMESCHIDHTRDEDYDSVYNGFYATVIEHLAHHLLFIDHPFDIGLTYSGNQWAIKELKQRVLEHYQNSNLPEETMLQDLEKAKKDVQNYLTILEEEV